MGKTRSGELDSGKAAAPYKWEKVRVVEFFFFPLRKLLCPMCISKIHICLTSTERKQITSPLIKELNYLEFSSPRQVCVFLGFSLRRF